MSHSHRLLLKWARLVHVYLTMFAFLVILFFAATGFILNHPELFDYNEKHETVVTGNVPTGLLTEPDKLAIVEQLRSKFGASGTLDSFESGTDQLEVRFKSPGRECEAVIQREDGQINVIHRTRGLLGLLTDLHRGDASGQHTGESWSLIIDGVAILLLIISTTGLILWTSLRSRGQHGLAFMGLGLGLCVAVYFLFVP